MLSLYYTLRELIFKCANEEYEKIIVEIEHYLQLPKAGSLLNGNDQESLNIQSKLRYVNRVDHNNFDFFKWEAELLRHYKS